MMQIKFRQRSAASQIKIIKNHIAKRFLYGKPVEEAEEKPLRILWAMIDQVRDIFMQPELIEGILSNK